MQDNRQRPRDGKRALIAPLIIGTIVAAVAVTAYVAQLSRRPAAPAAAGVAPLPPPLPAKVVSPPPPLARVDLIQEANAAASAYSSDRPSRAGKDALIGRTFQLRIPFGCDGPQFGQGTAQAYFEVDSEKKTLKLVARPSVWSNLPLVQELPAAATFESVEGFWVPRPWIETESCPPRHDSPAPATPTPSTAQTLGLAQFFEKGGSRILRRDGRSYEIVRKVAADDASPWTHTYHLILEGRLAGYANGRAVHCWSETPDHRPICLYAVEFSRVAFEDAKSGELLGEWRE